MRKESLIDIDLQTVKQQLSLAISKPFCDNTQIRSYQRSDENDLHSI